MSAMKRIGAVNTILVFSSTTIFGTVFSNLLLAVNIFLNNVVSISFIIVGIVFLLKKSPINWNLDNLATLLITYTHTFY